ncbi:phage tail fiber domain-containing protein, partial [Bacillus cereus group sp. Bce027]|uniref:phage tail fiber domain-containing protein n=1 Tax=Bacillus cereus group sp. Bce027 TaxID=3445241 RepID=UPI003F218D8C
TDFRFISKTIVQTTVPWGPADGYERIEIRRDTSATDRLVDFADGSILRASELNISQIQTPHVAEEARNMVADTISENADGDLDARGRRLAN